VLVLMVVGACVVGGGGWVARALLNHGDLPADTTADQAFYVATDFLARPGIFGLVLAALTAALMSTVDTLITAVAAITVNDVYRVHVRPDASEKQLMRVARITSVSVTVLGVILVPVFMNFDSIYDAHGAFTAAVTPPLVVTLLMSVFWRRYTATAATCTIVGGLAAIGFSLFVPEVVIPFAHGVPMKEDVGEGLFSGMKQFKFMRACYGIGVSTIIATVVTLFTKPEPVERQRGLVMGTIADALKRYKGTAGSERDTTRALATPRRLDVEATPRGEARLPIVTLSVALANRLEAVLGDLVHVTDTRWWLGGLRSTHAVVGGVEADDEITIMLGPQTYETVVSPSRRQRPMRVERLY